MMWPIIFIFYIFPMLASVLALPLILALLSEKNPRPSTRGDYLVAILVGILPCINWVVAAFIAMVGIYLFVKTAEHYFNFLKKPMFWE